MKKGSDTITTLVLSRIREYVVDLADYDPTDPQFPMAICGHCRNILTDISQGKKDTSYIPDIFNYKLMVNQFDTTNNDECLCPLCKTARTNFKYQKVCIEMPIRKISKNLKKSSILKIPNMHSGDSSFEKSGGASNSGFSVDSADIEFLRSSLSLTTNQTKKCTAFIRKKFGRNAVESSTDFSLSNKKNVFIENIQTVSFEMDISQDKDMRSLVLCHDVEDLLYKILEFRNIDFYSHMVKIGIDGGQQFLKICMSVLDLEDATYKSSQNAFSDGGVKKILVLGLCENIKESYENLSKMLNPMNLHKMKFYLSVDLKVASIILGIQSASSAYPCIYCEVSRNEYSNVKDQDMEDSNQIDEKLEGIDYFTITSFLNIL